MSMEVEKKGRGYGRKQDENDVRDAMRDVRMRRKRDCRIRVRFVFEIFSLSGCSTQFCRRMRSRECEKVILSIADEPDGGKTLYATFTRRSVYVSPNGDDGNSGTDERNPFKTMSHLWRPEVLTRTGAHLMSL